MQSAGAEGTLADMGGNGPEEELRLVLIGKTGSGKSASRKTILSWSHFLSKNSSRSTSKLINFLTTDYQVEEEAGGMKRRMVVVVNFPGFGDTQRSQVQITEEVSRCMALSAPGLHAFLLTVPLGRFTEEENAAATMMAKEFGEVALRNHTVVLFTRGDDLGEPIEEYLASAPASLKSLIDRCGGRYHVFNNQQRSDVKQVHQLIRKVEQMVDDSGGCYTNAMYQELEAALQEENRRRRVPEKGGMADDVEENRRRRRSDPKHDGDGDGEVENPAPSSSSGGILNRVIGLLSPSVLQKVKVVVKPSVVTGTGVGLVCVAAIPVAFVAGSALVGNAVGLIPIMMVGAAIGAVAALANGVALMAALPHNLKKIED